MPPGATGVNDFRWFHELGFTNPDGSAQSAGNHVTGAANHNWGHYETALATDRARGGPPGIGHNGGPALAPLHGRTDWTGEQIQALGWVRQKAQDLQDRGGYVMVDTPQWGPQRMHKMSWEEAMRRANYTPFDHADRQTFNAVHEGISGWEGHIPGLKNKSPSIRCATPRSACGSSCPRGRSTSSTSRRTRVQASSRSSASTHATCRYRRRWRRTCRALGVAEYVPCCGTPTPP